MRREILWTWWPIGIVTSETTMLGAMLATLPGFLVESRLSCFRPMSYHGTATDGAVLLSLSKLSRHSVDQCRSILAAAGASLRIEFNPRNWHRLPSLIESDL